jgi:hypothetical protein
MAAVRAQGAGAIRAAVFLVLWLTALGFVYLLWHAIVDQDPSPSILRTAKINTAFAETNSMQNSIQALLPQLSFSFLPRPP